VKESEEDGDGNTISLKKRKVNSMTTEFEDAQLEVNVHVELINIQTCFSFLGNSVSEQYIALRSHLINLTLAVGAHICIFAINSQFC
jgi:hypothetical protein